MNFDLKDYIRLSVWSNEMVFHLIKIILQFINLIYSLSSTGMEITQYVRI